MRGTRNILKRNNNILMLDCLEKRQCKVTTKDKERD